MITSDSERNNYIIVSRNDKRAYEIIRLDNNIEIILMSDKTIKNSTVALTVNAGSYDETDGFFWAAHYLEHMLFLGTEKYPEVGAYNQFIADNGGINNAYTSMDHTN